MNLLKYSMAFLLMLGMIACEESVTDPDPDPTPNTDENRMVYKQGAQYEYTTYTTDAETGEKVDATERTRTLTMVATGGTAYGQSNVAVYIDSIFNAGVFVEVNDSLFVRQDASSTDFYRYASLLPELDITGLVGLDFGSQWMHESRVGATAASWVVARLQDTVQYDTGIPAVEGVELAVTDSAVASVVEDIVIGGATYSATKTTHRMVLSASLLVTVLGIPASIPFESQTLLRTTWTVPKLGAIVKEEREGGVLGVSYTGESVEIPVPGYVSTMTRVVVTGD